MPPAAFMQGAAARRARRPHRASRLPPRRDAVPAARLSRRAMVTRSSARSRRRRRRRRRRPRRAPVARVDLARARRRARPRDPGALGAPTSASSATSPGTSRRHARRHLTPTYSGCPATAVISRRSSRPLLAHGRRRNVRARDAARAGLDHRLDHAGGAAKAARLRHRAAVGRRARRRRRRVGDPRHAARRGGDRLSALRLARTPSAISQFGSTPCKAQLPLRRLPRALRLLQAALSRGARRPATGPFA